ncbi:HDOD domain-containing protein [Pseudoalteromonas denitrificans]|uniref:HDOD domain-containing protein n=1 Tax=Pseudoalteromonas denitrificans DSM 6059 TaxID=1123010 RepID=A0A1I1KU26_9GAMM|nr:HDOD domain-containing protein [Pseudoalteromonas denitrificans]SFC62228.1 HDOD domain-containing protein [Pseudoalteromonas denitrificans DSM 6059]
MIYVDNLVLDDVSRGFHIPAKPEILEEFQLVMADKDASVSDEATIVSKDLSLSSAILKAINSPFFGLTRTISNIHQAVCFMGMEGVNYLATALLLKNAFEGETSCLSFDRFWNDATDIAQAMVFVSKNISCNVPSESLYTVGLFHDCGVPAMALQYEDYKNTLDEADELGFNSIIIENEKYKTNHAIVGYFIASSWHLPKDICNIILQHHELDFLFKVTGSEEQLIYATLKIAENITERKLRFRQSSDWQFIGEDVLNVLGINTDEYADLEESYCATRQ